MPGLRIANHDGILDHPVFALCRMTGAQGTHSFLFQPISRKYSSTTSWKSSCWFLTTFKLARYPNSLCRAFAKTGGQFYSWLHRSDFKKFDWGVPLGSKIYVCLFVFHEAKIRIPIWQTNEIAKFLKMDSVLKCGINVILFYELLLMERKGSRNSSLKAWFFLTTLQKWIKQTKRNSRMASDRPIKWRTTQARCATHTSS